MDHEQREEYYNAAAGFIRRYVSLARQAARRLGYKALKDILLIGFNSSFFWGAVCFWTCAETWEAKQRRVPFDSKTACELIFLSTNFVEKRFFSI